MKNISLLYISGLCLAAMAGSYGSVSAADQQSFSFKEDFEGPSDPVKLWRSNNNQITIQFKGLTKDKKFSGKSAFKIDLTVPENSYACWQIPLEAFSDGKLKFSARVLVDAQTTGKVRFGPGFGIIPDFPAYDGLNNLLAPCPAGNEWQLIEGDAVALGKALLKEKLPGLAWGIKEENTSFYMNGLYLYLYPPEKGAGRFVVYLDDVKVEGDAMAREKYITAVEKRWEPAKAVIKDKLDAWDNLMAAQEQELSALTNLTAEASQIKDDIREKIPHMKRRIITARSCGFIPAEQPDEMAGYFAAIKGAIDKIKSVSAK